LPLLDQQEMSPLLDLLEMLQDQLEMSLDLLEMLLLQLIELLHESS